MLNKSYCATCIGVEAVVVTVEVDLSVGIGIHLVGLPDSAVRESLLRVITALTSYGFHIPGRKIVVNLAPADIRKEGSAYDLAIALGMLAASEQVSLVDCDKFLIMGELALDGRLRAVNGVLPVALKARDEGFGGCIFPAESAQEAAEIDGLAVYGVSSLAEAIEVLTRRELCDHLRVRRQVSSSVFRPSGNDFRQVRGQSLAKRGMEIAAAGGHNIIILGYLYTGAKKTISPQFVNFDFRLFLSKIVLYFPQPQHHKPHHSGTKFNLVQIESSVGHPT